MGPAALTIYVSDPSGMLMPLLEQHSIVPFPVSFLTEDTSYDNVEMAILVGEGAHPSFSAETLVLFLPLIADSAKAAQEEWVVLEPPFSFAFFCEKLSSLVSQLLTDRKKRLSYGSIAIDYKRRVCEYCGETIALTEKELQLLSSLLQAAPASLSASEIKRLLWGRDDLESHSLESHIYSLRKKLSFAGPDVVETVEKGYVVRLPL